MSTERCHTEEVSYQMLPDNSDQNCPMSHQNIPQRINTSVGVLDNYMNLGAGRFGTLSQIHQEQSRPSDVPHSQQSALMSGNVAVLNERYSLPAPVNYRVPHQQAVDASTLMCPIMMLKKPANFQKNLNTADAEYQDIPNSRASLTQHDVEFDTLTELGTALQCTESDRSIPLTELGRAVQCTELNRTVLYPDLRAVPYSELNRSVVPGAASVLTNTNCTESGVLYNYDLQSHAHVQATLMDRTYQRNPVARSSNEQHYYELQGGRHASVHRKNQESQFPGCSGEHVQQHSYHYGHHTQLSACDGSYFPPHNSQYSMERGANQFNLNHEPILDNRGVLHYHQTHVQCHQQLSANVPQYVSAQVKEGGFQDGTAHHVSHQRKCPGFMGTASSGINPRRSSNLIPSHIRGTAHHFYQQPLTGSCHQGVNIRLQEKDTIKRLLKPGQVIQVCGGPMVGKSTIVRQAINEAALSGQLIQHHIACKEVFSFQDFLSLIVQKFYPQQSHGSDQDTDTVLSIIRSVLQPYHLHHHILVFHKCENLKDNPHGRQFLDFLTRIISELATVPVTIVFTTYKFYWFPPNESACNVEIGVLSIFDIVTLLHYYVPQVDVVTYAHVLEKTFCFPEAIRLIVEEFLLDEDCRITPEKLEKKINSDSQFLSQLFQSRLQDVETWVPRECLFFLNHFGHSIENSFTEAHLEYTNSSDMDQGESKKVISFLKHNCVVRKLNIKINRLVIHPLVVYYIMMSLNRDKELLPQKWFDNTCNRYTHFLGRVLLSAETSMQEHGRKGLVFGGLFQEWSNVRYVIQMALHCNMNTYENFIKVAVFASGFILKIFPKEAEAFYWGLYKSARDYGSVEDLAVMEVMLGQAVAEGTGIGEGKDWTRADGYLTSAIDLLSKYGDSYFLGQALLRKAMILNRQGRYEESLGFFKPAEKVLRNVNRLALGEKYCVSEAKIEEEILTEKIQETMPIIFTGKPQLARKRLDRLLEIIRGGFENHPELATLLNLVGLTEQRGNKNLERALTWYKLSYNERMYLEKVCPENLLAVLNNIGVILFHQGKIDECMKYLTKALDIRRECGWTHYNTGLTLIHVAEINMKIGNYAESFRMALEAERIFKVTVKDHDMRLRANFVLAHIRSLIKQAVESERVSFRVAGNQDYCHKERCDNSEEGRGGLHRGRVRDRKGHGESETSLSTENESVRSSELFGAGGVNAGPNKRNNLRGKPLFSYSKNSPQIFPSSPRDIVRVIETEIEPCDLQISADTYLEIIPVIAKSLKGTLSDDGLSLVMCAHEHAMLLNWENSPEKFEEHKNALAQFSQDNPWLEANGATDGRGVDSRYRSLIKHKPLYSYIMKTPYSELDLTTFTQHMQDVCLTCRFAKSAFTTEMWMAEATHCIQERKKKKRLLQELDRMSIDSVSSVPERTSEDYRMLSDITNLDHRADNPLHDSVISAKAFVMDIRVPSEMIPGLPNFNELISNSTFPNQNSSYQLQNNHEYLEIPHPAIYQDQASAPSGNPLCQSAFVVPRIVNDQRNILEQILKSRSNSSTSHSAGEDIETDSLGAFHENRHISMDTKTRDNDYLQVFREPVEQSYDGDQGSSWISENNCFAQDKESQCKFQKNVFDEFSQHNHLPFVRNSMFGVDSTDHVQCHALMEVGIQDRQNNQENVVLGKQIIPDFGRAIATADNLSKFHLVQEECRSNDLSGTNRLVRQLGMSTDNKPNSSSQIEISSHEHKKFSTFDYLNRNHFNVILSTNDESGTQKLSRIDESEIKICKSHRENSWQNEQNIILGSMLPLSTGHQLPSTGHQLPSTGHQLLSTGHQLVGSSEVNVGNSPIVTQIGSGSVVPNTNMEVLASTQRLPDLTESNSENESWGHAQHPLHDVHTHLNERMLKIQQTLQVLQNVEEKNSPEDSKNGFDSGHEPFFKMRFSDSAKQGRSGSGSESSSASQRSRTESASSQSSGGHVAQIPESGYLSQQHIAGARPKVTSGTDRSHQNLTTVNHNRTRHLKKSNYTCGPPNQGFGEIPFTTLDNFQAAAGSTHGIKQRKDVQVTLDFYNAEVKQSRTRQAQEIDVMNIGDQSEGFSNSGSTLIFLGNQHESSSSREPVEHSWNDTLPANELQARVDYVVPITGDMFHPELLYLQIQSNQSEQLFK